MSTAQKKLASEILGAMGKQIYVDGERYLDMATAVSGSGPAYLFYFVESFIDAAVALGWTPEVAKELAMGPSWAPCTCFRNPARKPLTCAAP